MTVDQLLQQISLAQVQIDLRALEPGRLPAFLGSTLRGALGMAHREALCPSLGLDCSRCRDLEGCAHVQLFRTRPGKEPEIWQGIAAWPRPLVMVPPLPRSGEWNLRGGERLTFQIRMFGASVQSWYGLSSSLEAMVQAGLGAGRIKFKLVSISSRTGSEESAPLFHHKNPGLPILAPESFNVLDGWTRPPEQIRRCRVDFLTSTRIKHHGSFMEEQLPFQVLMKALLARASSLAAFHCKVDPTGIDARAFLESAEKVEVVESSLRRENLKRRSNTQDTDVPLDGMSGSLVYEGEDLSPFLGLLKAGEMTGVGKSTVMGLGRYEVTFPQVNG